ncbi:hypothetical protein P3T36_001869 [Kitasatospora sp. MAP12-15]|uniref:hypothetical protein n=1 Tax=unclassified Kitasatospora TaxID=2633591 RepID=UPI00247565EE|nr:hypothetical protein [Kitasatospora sp. MAP12-44]MDH6113246.1 hypothetical protein [Kitasatospora sp. MAP12-44]
MTAAVARRGGQLTDRLRQASATAPGRLRLSAVALVVLVLAFGALTGWQVTSRTQAADRVVSSSQPLSENAAEIYRSLADADTTAAAGFLLAGNEPPTVRQRYQADLATASQLLTQAATHSAGSAAAVSWISQLNQQLPVYSGLVETARAIDRQGLPLGAAYLRYASGQMQNQLLPTAQKLSDYERGRVDQDYADAQATPWAVYVLGLLVAVALVWFQLVLFRRTNRVFNLGVLSATAAVLATLVWLTAGVAAADAGLSRSRSTGAGPLQALNSARIDALQARTAENLNLVARGSTTTYADQWTKSTDLLATTTSGGQLGSAQQLAPAGAGQDVADARSEFFTWKQRHDAASAKNDGGDYQAALDATVGSGADGAQQAYQALDAKLAQAADVEKADFLSAAKDGRDATGTVVFAAGVLALLAAAGVLLGIGRRLAEYR